MRSAWERVFTVFRFGFVATAYTDQRQRHLKLFAEAKPETRTLRFSLSTNLSLTPFLNSTALLRELSLIGATKAGSILVFFRFAAGSPSSSRVWAEVEATGSLAALAALAAFFA